MCACVVQNGKISFEEFVCGLAVLLHGSFSSKCQLLFHVFNIHGDEGELATVCVIWCCCYYCLLLLFVVYVGISREELATMLHAILQSTNTIVMAVSQMGGGAGDGASGSAVMEGENREQAIRSMVDSAFRNCDITRTGKLLPLVRSLCVGRMGNTLYVMCVVMKLSVISEYSADYVYILFSLAVL